MARGPEGRTRPRTGALLFGLAVLLLCRAVPAGEPAPDLDGTAPPAPASEGGREDFSEPSQEFAFGSGLYARRLWEDAAEVFNDFLQSYPDDPRVPEVRYKLGRSLFELERYSEAEAVFEVFLREHDKHHLADQARLYLGTSRFQLGRYKEAAAALSPLGGADRPSVQRPAGYYLGRSLVELGRDAEAVEPLQRAAQERSKLRPLALYALGDLRLRQEAWAAARDRMQTFLKENPEHALAPAARLRLAEAHRRLGHSRRAARELRALIGKDPGRHQEARQGLLRLGWIQLDAGNASAAEQSARKGLALEPGELVAPLRYLLGSALLAQEKHAPAAEVLAKIDDGPQAQPALLQRIWAHLGGAQLEAAVESAQAYLRRFPKGEIGTAYYLLGTAHFRMQRYEKAAAAFAAAAGAQPAPYAEESRYQRAICFERTGEDDRIVDAWLRFLERHPQSEQAPTAWLGLANAYFRQETFEKALPAYQRVGDLEGASAAQKEQALLQRAACHYELEEYGAMDARYREVLAQYPRSPAAADALYWVGWGAQRQQKHGEAVKLFKEFLGKYGSHRLAPRAMYRLGISQYRSGREPRAAESFWTLLQEHPETEIGETELLWLGSFFLQHDDFGRGHAVFQALLQQQPEKDLAAVALYYDAEALRGRAERSGEEADWRRAAGAFRRLVEEDAAEFRSLGYFGLGKSLRHLGQLEEAEAAFDRVSFPSEDPMRAGLLMELGRLAEAQGEDREAIRHFMKVGLLYDEPQLAGEALYRAGRICERLGDLDRASTCYGELVSDEPGTYGARYGETSTWSERARERLELVRERQEAGAGSPAEETPADDGAEDGS